MRFLTLLLFLAGTAAAEEHIGSIYFEQKSLGTTSSYHISDAGRYEYTQQSTDARFRQKMYGTGALEGLKRDESTSSTDVPGVSAKGHSRLALAHENGKTYITTDAVAYGEVMGQVIELPLNLVSEVVFELNDWQRYKDGEYVFLSLTEDAKLDYLKAQVSHLDLIMKPLLDDLRQTGVTVSEMHIEDLQFDGKARIAGDLRSLTSTVTSASFRVRYDVYKKGD